MNASIDKKDILTFLKRHTTAVFSTVNKEGRPDAAPLYFVVNDDFDLFFITSDKTQKYLNISFQNETVLTVTDEQTLETVQIRGKAQENQKLLSEIVTLLAEKLTDKLDFPIIFPMLKHEGQRVVIQVKPYEIRWRKYTDDGLSEKKITL